MLEAVVGAITCNRRLLLLTAALIGWIATDVVPVRSASPEDSPQPAAAGDHWSFRPIRRPTSPLDVDLFGSRNAIDTFVHRRLRAAEIQPLPQASRPTLMRRLCLDLLGLPPEVDAVDRFVADRRPDAYTRVVDRLLASPHFGERWGRHWMDLARYADSDGYDNDKDRPGAWLYRRWVIEAYNSDMPFDQFTIEQLAGDLLPDPRIDQLIATGFQRNSPYNGEGGVDREEFRVTTVADRTNTVGTIWLGLTLSCARCHDHKYDPITQHEYYGLFAFSNSTEDGEAAAAAAGFKELDEEALQARIMREMKDPRETYVMIRGDFLNRGPTVQHHTPAVLHAFQPRSEAPDRLDFARWLVDSANPLTSRVAANRIWQHLFGQGLVETIEDFGTRGTPPTHPELLDWLASELVAHGWSRKKLIRTIIQSASYRRSSQYVKGRVEQDPANQLLARQNRFRLEGEIIRDSCLSAGGLLDHSLGVPSFTPNSPSADTTANDENAQPTLVPAHCGRTIYMFVSRTRPFPMMGTFDAPDTYVTCARRDLSNSPLQALVLMNNELFVHCAAQLGLRVARQPGAGVEDRVRLAFRYCVGRDPDPVERTRLVRLYEEQLELCRQHEQAVQLVADQPLPDSLSAVELAAWIGVGRVLLNIDEFVMRE